MTSDTHQFHDIGPLPLATSWIFQTIFINIFALYGSHIPKFSTYILVSHSLPSRCSLVPLCYVFSWKPLTLISMFLWSLFYNIWKPKASSANSWTNWIGEVNWNFGRACHGEQLGESCSLWAKVIQFTYLILWSSEHGYQIIKLLTTCSELIET